MEPANSLPAKLFVGAISIVQEFFSQGVSRYGGVCAEAPLIFRKGEYTPLA